MPKKLGLMFFGLIAASTPLFSQSVISAKAGLIHYLEGDATLDGKTVQPKFGEFPEIKNGQTLRTAAGRAEVLLGPGTILRMAENSEIKMVSNSLSDTKVEVASGSVILEAAEVEKDSTVRLLTRSSAVEIRKRGLYRINADPAELLVHDGEAVVTLNGQTSTVKDARRTPLEGAVVATKFNKQAGDPFYRWAARRAGSLAAANLSSARTIYHSDFQWNRTGWVFNPLLGFYTYIPLSGSYYSPFGYRYFSPRAIGQTFYPPSQPIGGGYGRGGFEPTYNPNLGYNTAARSVDTGYSGGAPAVSAAPAPSSGGGGDGGGHVRGDGGGSSGGGRGR